MMAASTQERPTKARLRISRSRLEDAVRELLILADGDLVQLDVLSDCQLALMHGNDSRAVRVAFFFGRGQANVPTAAGRRWSELVAEMTGGGQ
jgi:hypothetical protein